METRRALMLIYKEAMNNCLKYSDANCVEMTISSEDNILQLTLKDDGKGFDHNKKSDGYGLNNMRERAKKINYSIEISSKVNGGTKITLKGNIPHMGN
jgi:signal transduction histidine kinase